MTDMSALSTVDADGNVHHDQPVAYYDDRGRAIFRASGVNMCTKALVASLLKYEAVPVPPDMQRRFDAGHKHEAELLAHVAYEGWTLYGGQETYEVSLGEMAVIRGHLDSLGTHPEHGIAVIEAKTMAPKSYDKWLAKRFQGSDLFKHYADQTSIYMAATGIQTLVMVVGRKETFINDQMEEDTRIDAIDVSMYFEPPASVSRIKARLAKVVNLAKTGVLPETCDVSSYPCPVVYLHEGKQDPIWSDEGELDEFGKAMEAYVLAQRVEADGKKAKAEAKQMIDKLRGEDTFHQSGRYVMEYVPAPKTTFDEQKMIAVGLDPNDFKVTTPGTRISVKELT